MKCPKCGNEVAEGKKFCGKCGTRLTEGAPAANNGGVVCSKCGAPLTPGKKFCGKCGAPTGFGNAATVQDPEKDAELVQSAGFVHWNVLPGQLAVKIDEQNLNSYKGLKGFVIQDGTKAVFFVDGALAGELSGGKYDFKDAGLTDNRNIFRRFCSNVASFFTGRAFNLVSQAASIVIVLVRESEFPLVFTEKDIPTAGVRAEIGIQAVAKITNIIQFYKSLLMDKKFVSFESISSSVEPVIRSIFEENFTGVDADSISLNAEMRNKVLSALQAEIQGIYPFISVERILRLSAANAELEEIRRMREELYISEKELIELSKRNDFLNRLNDVNNQQLLREAQTAADFAVAMNKIDEQNLLTEDEKAKFADMLYWQRRLREAQSADEGNVALQKLEINGLLREEEIAILKADIAQRAKLKDLTDGQALALLTLQNNMALDAQKLQWEIEVGNKRLENQMNRQRAQDDYSDIRRRAEMQLDKEEMQGQMEMLRQVQAIREERENAEFKRRMEEESAARAHEQTMTGMSHKHEEEMRRMFQNMSAEQIMAANPDITPEAAAALAEKFKSLNAQAQIDMANQHSADIERIMSANAVQQQENMQQMMAMMGQMFGAQNSKKDAEIEAVRKDANDHQDRMTEIIKTQATAAYGAAGKILTPGRGAGNDEPRNPARSGRKDAKVCPSCGAALEDGASFCGECGTSL